MGDAIEISDLAAVDDYARRPKTPPAAISPLE